MMVLGSIDSQVKQFLRLVLISQVSIDSHVKPPCRGNWL